MPTRVCLFLTQNSFTRTPTYCTDLLAVTQLQLSEEIKMDWLMKSKSPKFPSDTTGSRYFFKMSSLILCFLSFPLSCFSLYVVSFSDSLFLVVPQSFKLPLFATINLSRKTLPELSLNGYLCATCQLLIQSFAQVDKTP